MARGPAGSLSTHARIAVETPALPVRVLLASGLLIFLAALTACSRIWSLGGPGGPPPLVVGYTDVGSAAPLLVAVARGLPADTGYELVAKRYASTGKLGAALRSGEVTMAVMPLSDAAALAVGKVPLIVVGVSAESFGRDGIVSTDSIDSLDEIMGLKVAVSSGYGAFFVWEMLSRGGLDPESVVFENVPYSSADAALASGEAGAAVLTGAVLRRAQRAPGRRVLLTTEDFPGVVVDVVVVSRRFADADARAVQRVLTAMGQAAEELAADAEGSRRLAAMEASVPAERVAAASAGLRYFSTRDMADLIGVLGAPGPLMQVGQDALIFQTERLGKGSPGSVEDFVDSRYVDPAKR